MSAAVEEADYEKLFYTVVRALATTRSNLVNIATALEMWAQEYEGQFPLILEPLQREAVGRWA